MSTGGAEARGGPLAGLRVVESASIGPGPHAALVLADLGADVVRVERSGGDTLQLGDPSEVDYGIRGRRSVVLDLKSPEDRSGFLALADQADVLLEGQRPGVMERLGVGPETCLDRNPRLVYARFTGWGQDGPLAQRAGHDINYVSLTGALRAMGRADQPPAPPLNLVGDYGGGSMLGLVGILAALHERASSGRGQVVDVSMLDGAMLLNQMLLALRGTNGWSDERQSNPLDGGAPFYDTYRCADGEFVAVGALEGRFFSQLLAGLGLDQELAAHQYDRTRWNQMREEFTAVFATRTRDEWAEHFADIDACVTPVLSYAEAGAHPHLAHRQTVIELGGVPQAGPAPRFSRTPLPDPKPPRQGYTPDDILTGWP